MPISTAAASNITASWWVCRPAAAAPLRCCRRRTLPATGSRSCSACRCVSRSTRRSCRHIRCASACRRTCSVDMRDTVRRRRSVGPGAQHTAAGTGQRRQRSVEVRGAHRSHRAVNGRLRRPSVRGHARPLQPGAARNSPRGPPAALSGAASVLASPRWRWRWHLHAGARHHYRQRLDSHHRRRPGCQPDQGTWVITSFAVSNGVSVPLTGWLMQRFGVVRTFVLSVLSSQSASFLCGAVLEPAVAARVPRAAGRGVGSDDSGLARRCC